MSNKVVCDNCQQEISPNTETRYRVIKDILCQKAIRGIEHIDLCDWECLLVFAQYESNPKPDE